MDEDPANQRPVRRSAVDRAVIGETFTSLEDLRSWISELEAELNVVISVDDLEKIEVSKFIWRN